MEQYTGNVSPY